MIQRTTNYGRKGGTLTFDHGDAFPPLHRQLTSESIREDDYQKWCGALAELYVELGLDRLNYHARWCVCLGDCRCQAVTHRDTP